MICESKPDNLAAKCVEQEINHPYHFDPVLGISWENEEWIDPRPHKEPRGEYDMLLLARRVKSESP